jgi:hypothetical protein
MTDIRLTTVKDVYLKHLKDFYLDDSSFKNDFMDQQINTNKYNLLVKYILAKSEIQYGGSELTSTNKKLTIENKLLLMI